MKKRIFGIILALALIVSLLPVTVLAETAEEAVQTEETAQTAETSEEAEQAALTAPEEDPAEEKQETQEAAPAEEAEQAEKTAGEAVQTKETAEEEAAQYDRTILMYICGSDLESSAGLASANIEQILSSEFSKEDRVKFIIMTGGAEQWYLDSSRLYDPSKGAKEQPAEISAVYNQIWEAVGADGTKNPGKLVLLDGDGVLGDGEAAVPAAVERSSEPHEWMSDPEVLRAFINYGAKNFPAEKYDLILWDHGNGPARQCFAKEEHDPSGNLMRFSELVDALRHNELVDPNGDGTPDRKYDFLNFDACLMSSVELLLAFEDVTNCYIASPEIIPGDGEVYTGWLNALGKDPAMDAYEVGKITVDDFYQFYESGYENGTKQEGTLAVFDVEKLMDAGFVSLLGQMNEIFSKEIADGMIYDELVAVRNSIQYGKTNYFDFGNYVSQFGIAQYERTGGEDTNAYGPAVLALCSILKDPEILYAKGTSGIRTGDLFYLGLDGEVKFADIDAFPLGTSGIYSYFTNAREAFETVLYYLPTKAAMKQMPEGENKKVLFDSLQNQVALCMLISAAQLVRTALDEKNEDGTPVFTKETLTYDSMREYYSAPPKFEPDEYWEEEDYEEFWDYASWYTTWKGEVLYYANLYWNQDDSIPRDADVAADLDVKARERLEEPVERIIRDEILEDQIGLYTITSPEGTGYQLRFQDTKKRMIAEVSADIYAEIPVAEEFLEQTGNRDLVLEEGADILIDQLKGEEQHDMDLDESTVESYVEDHIRWLNNDSATWKIPASENMCYALRDESGNLHVCKAEADGSKMLTMGGYPVEETVVDDDGNEETEIHYWPVGMYFTDGVLSDLMLRGEDGSWRPVLLKDLKTELQIVPCSSVMLFVSKEYVPLEEMDKAITISADTHLEITSANVADIPGIEDRNGDGQVLTKKIIVTDVFGYRINLSEKAAAPDGNLVDIKLAQVEPGYYDGTELTPKVICNGTVLTEGVDYKLQKMTDEVIFREVGDYVIALEGIGNFTGVSLTTFTILPGQEPLPEPDKPVITPDNPKDPARAPEKKAPKTSDPNNAGVWILLMSLGAVLAAGAGVVFRIRKQ